MSRRIYTLIPGLLLYDPTWIRCTTAMQLDALGPVYVRVWRGFFLRRHNRL
jgi:hypothetical protein